jgi:hypothetical protein
MMAATLLDSGEIQLLSPSKCNLVPQSFREWLSEIGSLVQKLLHSVRLVAELEKSYTRGKNPQFWDMVTLKQQLYDHIVEKVL